MTDKLNEPVQPSPYQPDRCWHGDPNPSPGYKQRRALGLCLIEGSLLYEVGKAALGLGTCRMYLCEHHRKALEDRGFTCTKVTIDRRTTDVTMEP